MIEDLKFSVKNLGGGLLAAQSGVPQEYAIPGWHWSDVYGWYYLHTDGQKYVYTGTHYQPLWAGDFWVHANNRINANNIGGPVELISGDNVELTFSFKWIGSAKTLGFHYGNCKIIQILYPQYWYNAGDWEATTVPVSSHPVGSPGEYSKTVQFQWLSASIWDNTDLFIVDTQDLSPNIVYHTAFTERTAEIIDLEITDYARIS